MIVRPWPVRAADDESGRGRSDRRPGRQGGSADPALRGRSKRQVGSDIGAQIGDEWSHGRSVRRTAASRRGGSSAEAGAGRAGRSAAAAVTGSCAWAAADRSSASAAAGWSWGDAVLGGATSADTTATRGATGKHRRVRPYFQSGTGRHESPPLRRDGCWRAGLRSRSCSWLREIDGQSRRLSRLHAVTGDGLAKAMACAAGRWTGRQRARTCDRAAGRDRLPRDPE